MGGEKGNYLAVSPPKAQVAFHYTPEAPTAVTWRIFSSVVKEFFSSRWSPLSAAGGNQRGCLRAAFETLGCRHQLLLQCP